MSIVIIDYDMGNAASIKNMLRKIEAPPATISADPAEIAAATKLILPGVGAFDAGMRNLEPLRETLQARVIGARVPILGICLGMQLFTAGSEEGDRPGLGWLDAETKRLVPPASSRLPIPHMGWNEVRARAGIPLFSGHASADDAATDTRPPRFYFVHSYHVVPADAGDSAAETTYGVEFVSAVARGNILGVQFHPEKSHRFGKQLLRNFVECY